MNIFLIITIIAIGLLNLSLGLTVYLSNKKRTSNLIFSAFTLFIVSWTVSNSLTDMIRILSVSLFWCRMSFASASLIALSFYYFSIFFPAEKKISKVSEVLIISSSIAIVILSFTPSIVKTVELHSWGANTVNGSLFYLFPIHFITLMVLAFFNLVIKYNNSKGLEKLQIQYLFAGTFFAMLAGLSTNIFQPLLTGTTEYAKFGPLSTILLIGFTAYAIIKHRLMDIRVLVLKSVVYSLMVALVAGVYIGIIYYAKTEYARVISQDVLLVMAGFAMVFGFQPIRRFLQRATDRIFAKGRYDPEKLLSQLGDLLSSKIQLEDLTQSVLETLTKEMRLTRAAFVLIDNLGTLEVKEIGYDKSTPTKIAWKVATKICQEKKETIVADELEEESKEKETLRNLQSEVLLPLIAEDKFVGLLALGEKRSGDMYTTQDLKLLEIIAPEAAIAIENAMLFREKEKRIQELDALHKIALSLGSTLDLNVLLKQVIDEAIKVTDAETGSIMLVDEQTNTLSIKVARGISPEIAKATRIRMGEGIAGWVAKTSQPLVLIDGQDIRFQDYLKREEIISAITVPLKVREKVIGVLSVNRKQNTQVFTEDNLRVITSFAAQAAEAIENARLFENLENTFLGTISALAAAVDAKDHYTYGHSEMVTELAVDTAKELMLPQEEIKKIEIASKLHDIGKIGIDGVILNKPGRLTPEERRIIEEHPKIAVDILKSVEPLKEVIPLILYHHERFDGSGYPLGLAGKSIPLGARILATADAFNAMVSDRPYRPALDIATAVSELRKNAGTQFDPEIVEAFLRVVEKKLTAKTITLA